MFAWFRATPKCPVEPSDREWIESRMDWLISEFGLGRLRSCDVVLPRPEFFPDPFRNKAEDAFPIFTRVCGYMGIRREDVELHFYEEHQPPFGTSHGTAGLYVGATKPFQIWIEVSNLHDPLSLVATMAHELAHVHLLGHGRISTKQEDHEPLTDLLTVFLGLGVITANSVLRENYWHEGHFSGWSMKRSGYLTMPMLAYALAIFSYRRAEKSPKWARELRSDVYVPWKQGVRFLADGSRNTSCDS